MGKDARRRPCNFVFIKAQSLSSRRPRKQIRTFQTSLRYQKYTGGYTMNLGSRTMTNEEYMAQVRMIADSRPDFHAHFAVEGCDLSLNTWWVSYTRQSAEELQMNNNALAEYLAI